MGINKAEGAVICLRRNYNNSQYYKNLELRILRELKELGVTEFDYPLDPYKLMKKLGIVLYLRKMSEQIRGVIIAPKNGGVSIVVNSMWSGNARRFIAMHELCHYLLHIRKGIPHYSKLAEWEANNGAALALMPSAILEDIYYQCNGNIECMCDFFSVSPLALTYRLDNIPVLRFDNHAYSIDFNEYTESIYRRQLLYGSINDNMYTSNNPIYDISSDYDDDFAFDEQLLQQRGGSYGIIR